MMRSNGLAPFTTGQPGTIIVAAHAWHGDVAGGTFRLATELATALAAGGRDVAYVCCNPSVRHSSQRRERVDDVEIWRYPAPKTPVRFITHVLRSALTVRAIMRERTVSGLIGLSPLQFLGAALALGEGTQNVIYTVPSPFDDELTAAARGGFTTRIAAGVARLVDRRNIATVNTVHVLSDYTFERLTLKHGRAASHKITKCPGWVDGARFQPGDRQAIRRALGGDWTGEEPLFFTLRRLEPRMGLDTLIDAAGMLHREGLSFRVLIGGSGSLDGPLRSMIEARQLQNHVRLLGHVPEERVPRCYAAADCFVLPTRALECFGLIVLEAFACDTPVIASDVAAIPELASEQGQEWLFPPGDAEALADRMRRFIAGDLRPPASLRTIAGRYDRALIVPRWAALVTGTAAANSAQPVDDPQAVGVEVRDHARP